MVKGLNITLPHNITREDLLSFGLNGLYKAVKTYDAEKGKTFDAYAKFKIKAEMLDSIRTFGDIPRSVFDRKKKIQKAINELESTLKRNPTDDEIINYMNISEAEYRKYMNSFNYGIDFSLNDIFYSSDDEVGEYTMVKDRNCSFDNIEKAELKQYLGKVIDTLNDREKKLIYLRYYRNLTFREISHVLDLSESTVEGIHNRTLIYLRTKLLKDMMI